MWTLWISGPLAIHLSTRKHMLSNSRNVFNFYLITTYCKHFPHLLLFDLCLAQRLTGRECHLALSSHFVQLLLCKKVSIDK